MTITIAFYKGTREENPLARLFDRLVCWRTHGRFSHVEIVRGLRTDGLAICMSSSWRDDGVRIKAIDLTSGRWELVQIPGDVEHAASWFADHLGQPYDAFGLLAWVLPWRVSDRRAWFCSEACAQALGLAESWHTSPNDLFHIALMLSASAGRRAQT